MKNFSIQVPVSRWPEIEPALAILYELKSCAFLGPRNHTREPGGPYASQVRGSDGKPTGDVMFYIVEYPNES